MDNLQENLTCKITDKVIDGQRVFKIVDGTKKLKTAKEFATIKVKNLGFTIKDEQAMGKIALENYCTWWVKNRDKVRRFYEGEIDVVFEEVKG